MKAFIISALILPLFFLGCKKYEQPDLTPLNEDCDCASEVSAAFEILELESLPQFNPIGTDSDTIFHNKNVIFRAKAENAEYTWYIGANIYDTKEVGLNFSAAFGGQDITVSLVVNKPTNAICFPNDDGYDSISRTFHVQPYGHCDFTTQFFNDTTLLEGIYRMKSNLLPDSFNVVIDYYDDFSDPKINILNFDGMGTNRTGLLRCSAKKTYRQLYVEDGFITNGNYLEGSFHYKLDDTAEFIFTTGEYIGGTYITDYYKHHLVGRKL